METLVPLSQNPCPGLLNDLRPPTPSTKTTQSVLDRAKTTAPSTKTTQSVLDGAKTTAPSTKTAQSVLDRAKTTAPSTKTASNVAEFSHTASCLFGFLPKTVYLPHMRLIKRNMAQIIALCEKHKVMQLYVFGSVLTKRFNKDALPLQVYGDNYFEFKFALEDLLKRDVDLVEYNAIKNPYFKEELDETNRLFMDRHLKAHLYDIATADARM